MMRDSFITGILALLLILLFVNNAVWFPNPDIVHFPTGPPPVEGQVPVYQNGKIEWVTPPSLFHNDEELIRFDPHHYYIDWQITKTESLWKEKEP